MMHVLTHMLGLKRPYGSVNEGSMIPYLIKQLEAPTWVDGAGNLHCDMRLDEYSRTLFVGHTDTMHFQEGINEYDLEDGFIFAKGDCLGADDAAGVAILCQMIDQRVPGYYIFTRGEEAGCVGSRYLANEYEDLLMQFDRAVAFDRKGTSDVIFWQRGEPCASVKFAEALSDALNDQGMLYMPAEGVYTDTAEFMGIIPECTNISCGYYDEHSKRERLDLRHWLALRDAACAIDWDALPCEGPDPDWEDEQAKEFELWAKQLEKENL